MVLPSDTTAVAFAIEPRSPRTRALLTCALAAGPLFLAVGVGQGLTRDGFDFRRNAISQLSLGALGWVQITTFLLTGALVIAGAVGLRRALAARPGGTWAPRLLGIFGVSFLIAGVFRADPGAGFPPGAAEAPASSLSAHGAVHMLSAMIGYLALCLASVVIARHFAAERQRRWAVACRLVPVGVLVGFAGSAVTVLAFTAAAGLGFAWLTAVAAQLLLRPTSPAVATPRARSPEPADRAS